MLTKYRYMHMLEAHSGHSLSKCGYLLGLNGFQGGFMGFKVISGCAREFQRVIKNVVQMVICAILNIDYKNEIVYYVSRGLRGCQGCFRVC
jgi:hypothetical protein